MIEVVYMINATGVRITKVFYHERPALALKHKLEHSKKCTLIGYLTYPS